MILTITFNPAVDHTVSVDQQLEEGVVLRANSPQYDAGGKGINISKYLKSLGVDTLATGLTGGFLGQYIEDQLDQSKVPNDFVQMGGCTRLNTTILATDGEYKVNQSGHRVKRETVQELVAKIVEHDPETVVMAGSLPPNLGPSSIDRVAQAGRWETIVDVSGSVLKALSAEYALCKPNREELGDATGMPVHTIDECIEAAEHLRSMGFERVIASLGADGAILVGPEDASHAEALDVEVVDTVGAGDSLLAGALAELAIGKSPENALRHGIVTSSRVVSVPGTTVPDLDGVNDEAVDIPLYVD